VRVHRTRTLTSRDRRSHHGISITSPARTLLDLADVLGDAALARAFNEARVMGRVTRAELGALLDRSPGRRVGVLQPLIARPAAATRSAFEDAFLAFVERYGLPRPEVNRRIAGYEVDMVWLAQRVIIELDGRAYHDDYRAFERDRDKDLDLASAGFVVGRMTWRRLHQQPEREAQRLLALLERRRAGA